MGAGNSVSIDEVLMEKTKRLHERFSIIFHDFLIIVEKEKITIHHSAGSGQRRCEQGKFPIPEDPAIQD